MLENQEGKKNITNIERFNSYEKAKVAYAVVSVGETSLYANIILKKVLLYDERLIVSN